MPRLAPRPCVAPGCAATVERGRYCPAHRDREQQEQRERDRQRTRQQGSAAKRGYGRAWQKAREGFLAKHPLCVQCLARGQTVTANVVDHITPHRGDRKLFWDTKNWQALCGPCHSSKTAREDGGFGNKRN